MEYVYTAMLLHKAGKDVTEDAVEKVLKAAGVDVDASRVKALVAALNGVNIDEAIEKAAVVSAAPAAAAPAGGDAPAAEAKEEKKEEEKKDDADAGAGLGALFG
ncbi:50S ribosomal protein P1 [Candidatus Woesearchaeota archaeon]|nr:MAG: 50S ribosomal protein P1 [Candidatus Woesearchaeota archaeon]